MHACMRVRVCVCVRVVGDLFVCLLLVVGFAVGGWWLSFSCHALGLGVSYCYCPGRCGRMAGMAVEGCTYI